MNRRKALSGLGSMMGTAGAMSAAASSPRTAAMNGTLAAAAPAKTSPAGTAPAVTTAADGSRKIALPKDCVALVTGSNTGIGLGFVKVLLERGAKRVYATARRPETLEPVVALDPARVVAVPLDVTDDAQRRAAAARARDVTWLINNAGISGAEDPRERRFLTATSLDDAHKVMDTNFWAQAEMIRLFTPTILANGGGAIVQILSVGALYSVPTVGSYSASKFAARAMIAAVRAELHREPVVAAGVFTGGVNTRMTPADYKSGISPELHANQVLDALARGETDVFAGAGSREAYDRLRADPEGFERRNIERWFGPKPAGA